MRRLRNQNTDLDALDGRILSALAGDARTSVAELARIVGLSPPSAAERIRRLEEAGVIEGYTVTIDPKAVGLPVATWMRVRPMPGELNAVAEILRTMPEIVECDRVTGEDCFVARAHLRSIQDLERLIDQIIPHAMTTTSIIQSCETTSATIRCWAFFIGRPRARWFKRFEGESRWRLFAGIGRRRAGCHSFTWGWRKIPGSNSTIIYKSNPV